MFKLRKGFSRRAISRLMSDPHGEMSGWIGWTGKHSRPHLSGAKGPESLLQQRMDSSQAVCKDEVPSSNLGSSSRKPLFSIEKSGFLFEKAITKSW